MEQITLWDYAMCLKNAKKDIPLKYAVHEESVSYNSQDPKM